MEKHFPPRTHTFQSPLQIQNDSPNTSHHFKISFHPLSFPCPASSPFPLSLFPRRSLTPSLLCVIITASWKHGAGYLPLCFNNPSCYHHPQSSESRHAIDMQTECFKTTCPKLIRTIEQWYRLDQETLLSAVIWGQRSGNQCGQNEGCLCPSRQLLTIYSFLNTAMKYKRAETIP